MSRKVYKRLQGAEWHSMKDKMVLITYKINEKGYIKGFYKEKDRDGKWYSHWMNDQEREEFFKDHKPKVNKRSFKIGNMGFVVRGDGNMACYPAESLESETDKYNMPISKELKELGIIAVEGSKACKSVSNLIQENKELKQKYEMQKDSNKLLCKAIICDDCDCCVCEAHKENIRLINNWNHLKMKIKEYIKHEGWPEMCEAFSMVLETMDELEGKDETN